MLHDIVADKKIELAENVSRIPLEDMISLAEHIAPPVDFAAAISGGRVRLIAEIKKASPSRGIIRHDFDPAGIASIYARNNVTAISVLTEKNYFQGSTHYLNDIKEVLGVKRPALLRKDFIFDPYQVYESRVCGADSLLLIAAILTPPQLEEMINISRFLHMEPLVEVHDEAELDAALACNAGIIGINNRDLNTFKVDINVTAWLRPLIPPGKLVVSESGISTREHMLLMKELEVNAVLVGEALMTAPDIGARIRELGPA
ncbi:MAG: indole-3-glycerol phosphate synthase TrpC [Dehalococcoidia bacterium]|nr:indole-3-glycerol phosphate synthase TrpC [Dehalococcoidia bacterium]